MAVSSLYHLNCTPTTTLRGFRVAFPVPSVRLEGLPMGSFGCVSPPTEETGKAIIGVQFR